MGLLFIVLALALATLCSISIFKNFFSSHKLMGKGIKDILVIALVIAILICSALALGSALDLDAAISQLNKGVNLSQDQIQLLESIIPLKRKFSLIFLTVGYAMYVLHLLIFKSIEMDKEKDIKEISKNKWSF